MNKNNNGPSVDDTNTGMTTNTKMMNSDYDPEVHQPTIKLNFLCDYLGSQEAAESLFREAFEHTRGPNREILIADCGEIFFHDQDGDLAMDLSSATGMLMAEVAKKNFRSALGLILIAEREYEPTRAQHLLNEALRQFQPLVQREELVPAALLHEFLEVSESLESWFSRDLRAHQLVRDVDYIFVIEEDYLRENPCVAGGMHTIFLTPMTAEKMACATQTLRGRKVKACLIHPRGHRCGYAEYHPSLLNLLSSPPSLGHSAS